MKPTATRLTFAFTLLLSVSAMAQEAAEKAEPSPFIQLVVGFLPLGIFLLVLWFFFRRYAKSPQQAALREYMTEHVALLQRQEAVLERIATALEQRNPKGE